MTIAELDVNTCLRDMTLRVRLVGTKRLRFRLAVSAMILRLAGLVAGYKIIIETGSADFSEGEPSTWTRHDEPTPDGGRIVLVRYPEGYRLRYHGETVWKQP